MMIKDMFDRRCLEMKIIHEHLTSLDWIKGKSYMESDILFAYYEKDGIGINIALGLDEDIKKDCGY